MKIPQGAVRDLYRQNQDTPTRIIIITTSSSSFISSRNIPTNKRCPKQDHNSKKCAKETYTQQRTIIKYKPPEEKL